MPRRLSLASSAPLVTLVLALLSSPTVSPAATAATRVAVERIAHGGWPDALRLRSTTAEAIVVPAIGRVMSFRLIDGENVFWADPALAGRRGDPTGQEWVNFGGDKSWPAPEAEWRTFTGYGKWMPPPGFDGLPHAARIDGEAVVLTAPVDRFYGVRHERRISLAADAPRMTIATTYTRVSGAPQRIGIWVITQFADPVAVFVPVPPQSRFPDGHYMFREAPWPQREVRDGLIRVTRDPGASRKLGSDADRMLWVGETVMCLVASPRVDDPVVEYPDRGASAEVYTNPDPKRYVELETLGPLATLKPGERIEQTNTYTLFRRTASSDPATDARRILGTK
jgi:hypothetical protein